MDSQGYFTSVIRSRIYFVENIFANHRQAKQVKINAPIRSLAVDINYLSTKASHLTDRPDRRARAEGQRRSDPRHFVYGSVDNRAHIAITRGSDHVELFDQMPSQFGADLWLTTLLCRGDSLARAVTVYLCTYKLDKMLFLSNI